MRYEVGQLVPDLLLGELPPQFFLDVDRLNMDESEDGVLGGGVAGAVYRGTQLVGWMVCWVGVWPGLFTEVHMGWINSHTSFS